MKGEKFLAIEIGGTKLQIAVGNASGNVLSAYHFNVNQQEGAQGIRNNIERTIAEHKYDQVDAIGVGFGGPVNRQTGRVETSFHIDGWSGFEIAEWLTTLLRIPVFVDNDANVAALGEAVHGAGRDYNHVLYVTLGSGIGGGLVIDRQIYYGKIPGEVEIGHIRMNRNGDTLQSLCSGWAIDEKIRKAVEANPEGALAGLVNKTTGSEAVFLKEAVDAGDVDAMHIFEQLTDNLAYGFSHAVHLLHPEVLVLGGGLSLMGEMLRKGVETKLATYLMKSFVPGPDIKLAQLREKAVPVGCLALCSQKLKNNYTR